MNIIPQSPRLGRSPRLKAKWLSNTMAYQYGNNGIKKNDIIVLSNDLDQYLQDIFHSVDTKGRGKISVTEFRMLCDVLNIRESCMDNLGDGDMSFKDFHDNLCEHFACYGDYTGFLVNQTFRTINSNSKEETLKQPDCTKRSSFQKKMANSTSHKCLHDAELFKNWDKLRLSGFRLSEMKEQIDHMLFEVTFHKEESQTLKEIIEDLRSMLQASDAQNIGMQVALKRYQRTISSGDSSVTVCPAKTNNRYSVPIDESHLLYQPLKGEEKSLRIMARELSHLRELRDKEVKELINFNNQLQNDVTDLSREICRLEAENKRQAGKLGLIVETYNCCRELFAICVESFKEVETDSASNDFLAIKTQPTSPILTLNTFDRYMDSTNTELKTDHNDNITDDESVADEQFPPEVILIKRLEYEISTQLSAYNAQQQEMFRLNQEISICRRHLQSANFQVEALETECSRLLALEDQLVSVFRLLQKGRSQCLSRKTLGQLLLDVIDSSFGDDEQDMTAEQFIRILQKSLSECPLFLMAP